MTRFQLVSNATAVRMSGLLVVCMMGMLSACDGGKTAPKEDQSAAQDTAAAKPAATDPVDEGLYHFSAWQKEPAPTVSVSAVSAMSAMGLSGKTKSVLDYYGNTAIQYDLHGGKVEYLSLIDSGDLFEVSWLRPEKVDIPESQVVSTEHTRKVFELARGLMGEAGGELVKSMVTKTGAAEGDSVGAGTVGGKQVLVARCDYFDCRLIIKK